MNQTSEKMPQDRKNHTPLVPQQEIQSHFQAITLFVPMALKYLARHLTIGSYIRIRRIVLRQFKRVYYV
jgi:hypothetical protein